MSKSAVKKDAIKVFLTSSKLDPTEGIDFVKCEEAGAVIMFGGTTRNSFEDKKVSDLSYEAHEKLACRSLERIALEALDKFSDDGKDTLIHKVYLAHRLGHVPVKEESVLVVLSSTHRQEGWKAAEWVLEKIKAEAEIWKKENYNDGTSSWKENENSSVHKKN
ncbi:hypothetical protein BN7_2331 [Wickerhamomyces ciferrii]|uniref:Uncharacterized protein n=1 Tax=Wickerhamomyces ciferrii (strain ATCC 14091 / BCRC 22168 / CBS 111 / JCM 3599 / NBRC 0793 / NRRL Y-1031 F-60-10) TaxID=1206466 RepID=K0KKX3_WICCF|nr:uncharacterized protein BN7_2331 [Wickerhamomyces ciferrii]CCH42787.1 hypothetical protein BN7_2331 [Wickerhamomyces ciferrii]